MTLAPPPYAAPGGLLWLEYSLPGAAERHQIKMHVAHFSPLPIGASNNYSYDSTGPVVPGEGFILDTVGAFGALWAAYYPPDWSLSVVSLYYNSGGRLEVLSAVPQLAPIAGTLTAPVFPPGSTKRIFALRSVQDSRRRLWFSQTPSTLGRQSEAVAPTVGGIDARDQTMMAYLSGATPPSTGMVAPDGQRFQAGGRVYQGWARPVEAASSDTGGAPGDIFVQSTMPAVTTAALWVNISGGVSPYPLLAYDVAAGAWLEVGAVTIGPGDTTVLSTACVTFPESAVLCNPSAGLVTLSTPAGEHQWDGTGITLPGGSRLEVA